MCVKQANPRQEQMSLDISTTSDVLKHLAPGKPVCLRQELPNPIPYGVVMQRIPLRTPQFQNNLCGSLLKCSCPMDDSDTMHFVYALQDVTWPVGHFWTISQDGLAYCEQTIDHQLTVHWSTGTTAIPGSDSILVY